MRVAVIALSLLLPSVLGVAALLIVDREFSWMMGVLAGLSFLSMFPLLRGVEIRQLMQREARDRLADTHELLSSIRPRGERCDDERIHEIAFTIATDGKQTTLWDEHQFDYPAWREVYETSGLTPPRTLLLLSDTAPLLPLLQNAGPRTEFVEPEHLRMGRIGSICGIAIGIAVNLVLIAAFVMMWLTRDLPIWLVWINGVAVLILLAKLIHNYGVGPICLLIAPGRFACRGLRTQWEVRADESVMILHRTHGQYRCDVYSESGALIHLAPCSLRDKQLARLWTLWNFDGPPAPPIFEPGPVPSGAGQ
ncbi:MAG: hypothetical protein EA376_06510 [Phycisphaeraceae bacterium]|nr:MAG: hypothetical protein EA376_06510 [Phycisphaeraceae bacterium]